MEVCYIDEVDHSQGYINVNANATLMLQKKLHSWLRWLME